MTPPFLDSRVRGMCGGLIFQQFVNSNAGPAVSVKSYEFPHHWQCPGGRAGRILSLSRIPTSIASAKSLPGFPFGVVFGCDAGSRTGTLILIGHFTKERQSTVAPSQVPPPRVLQKSRVMGC